MSNEWFSSVLFRAIHAFPVICLKPSDHIPPQVSPASLPTLCKNLNQSVKEAVQWQTITISSTVIFKSYLMLVWGTIIHCEDESVDLFFCVWGLMLISTFLGHIPAVNPLKGVPRYLAINYEFLHYKSKIYPTWFALTQS